MRACLAGLGTAWLSNAFWCKGDQNWAYGTGLRTLQNGVNIFTNLCNLHWGIGYDPKSETSVVGRLLMVSLTTFLDLSSYMLLIKYVA